MLICDDNVRVEMGGTTLVGVCHVRRVAPPGVGPMELPGLSFVAIVSGLEPNDRVGFRRRIRVANDREQPSPTPAFSQAAMRFPGPGTHEVVIDRDTKGRQATCRYRSGLERAMERPSP